MSTSYAFLTPERRKIIEDVLQESFWWGNPDVRRINLGKLGVNTKMLFDYLTPDAAATLVVKQFEQRSCLSLAEFITKYLEFNGTAPDGQLELRGILQELQSYVSAEIANANVVDNS